MNVAHIDYESYSACDLKGCGSFRYAADASTEILCIGLAWNDEEPVIWTPSDHPLFNPSEQDEAEHILSLLSHPDTLVVSHNVLFEVALTDVLFERTTGFKPPAHHQWRCTMAMARRAALPPSLEKCAEALGLPQKKDHRGKALIRKLCVPQKDGSRNTPATHPKEFQELCEYCKQDTRVEREIHKKLSHFELTGFALETFQADLAINTRGFPVNTAAIKSALEIVDSELAKAEQEFKALTGYSINQQVKILAWLKERGYEGDNLTAGTLEEEMEDDEFDPTTEVGQALLLRKRTSFAAIKKLSSMSKCALPHNDRVCGTHTYHGAGTGRWSGSLVQPQNFKRPTIKFTEMAYQDICKGMDAGHLDMVYGMPLETIASCIRHFIHDPKVSLLDADFAAIEGRIVCWLAGQEDALNEYRNHLDRYKVMASVIYGKPADQINKHPERFVGKAAVLGAGYGMSAAKFRDMVAVSGYELPEGLEVTAIKAFREKHHKVVEFWYACEEAATSAMKAPGKKFKAGDHVSYFVAQTAGIKYLFAVLPSGRKIAYPWPKLEPQLRWKEDELMLQKINPTTDDIKRAQMADPKYSIKEATTVWGQIKGRTIWGRVSYYGGRWCENLCQAVAADIMANGVINAERAGYQVVALIHDQALALYEPHKGQSVEEFVRLLTSLPPWAKGLPIEAEGAIHPYYTK